MDSSFRFDAINFVLGKIQKCTLCQIIIFKKYCILLSGDIFLPLQMVDTLMKCSIMLHFIWVFTVCKSTRLGVSQIQAIKQAKTESVNVTSYSMLL